ncbi:MAG: hypothetical protein AAF358_10020 [Pseudomonadota bacterium]
MPIAGKALVIHLLEQLRSAGFRHLRFAAGPQQSSIRRRVGDGLEWDMTIRYSDLGGDDLRNQTLVEFGECSFVCADQLQHFPEEDKVIASPTLDQIRDCPRSVASEWNLQRPEPFARPWSTVSAYQYWSITNASDYHALNLAIVNGELEGMVAAGNPGPGQRWRAWRSEVARSAHIGSSVLVGDHCKVHAHAQLDSQCVLNNGAIVGRHCHLHNVVVLPNTQIGPRVRLRDAVVGPAGMFDLAGRYWPIRNPDILSTSRSYAEQKTGLPEQLAV